MDPSCEGLKLVIQSLVGSEVPRRRPKAIVTSSNEASEPASDAVSVLVVSTGTGPLVEAASGKVLVVSAEAGASVEAMNGKVNSLKELESIV